jgi:hypothetical protein
MAEQNRGKRAERLQVMLTEEEVQAVEDWRFENRMPSRSAAVRALMNLGLGAETAARRGDGAAGAAGQSSEVGVVQTPDAVGRMLRPEEGTSPRVLVASDDFLTGEGLAALLLRGGYSVPQAALSLEAARDICRTEIPAAAVLAFRAADDAWRAPAAGLAAELRGQDVPVLICPDLDPSHGLPPELASAPVIHRAEVPVRLLDMVGELLDHRSQPTEAD